MQKYLLVPVLCTLVLAGCNRDPYQVENPDPNHTHADFAIWINGNKIDFSDAKYMSGVSYDDASHDEADEYHHEHLHLHDSNDAVLHRHKPGLTIGEFFDSIGTHMTQECVTLDTGASLCTGAGGSTWRMFVNSIEQTFDPSYAFEDLDQILLTYGSSDQEIQTQLEQITDDACLYSRRCPWRGDPPEENCIADPAIPCVVPEDEL